MKLRRLPRRWLVALALLGFVVLILTVHGAQRVPDSTSYAEGSFVRPPLVFLAWSCAGVFGSTVQPHFFSLLQSLLAVGSASFLATQLAALVRCDKRADVVLTGLLCLPQLQAAGTVSSESLAYSFFCACVGALALLARVPSKVTTAGIALLCAGLCYQTRPQFVFLLPICAAVCVALLIWRRSRTERKTVLLSSCGALGVLFLVQAIYFLPRTGRLTGASMAGLQLVTVVGHIAADADVAALPETLEGDFARGLRARLVREGLSADTPRRLVASWHFDAAYNPIVGQVFAEFNERVAHRVQLSEPPRASPPTPHCSEELYCPIIDAKNPRIAIQAALNAEDWHTLNALTTKVSFQLLRTLKIRYVIFVLRMIYEHAHYWMIVAALALVGGLGSLVRRHPADRAGAPLAAAAAGGLWWVNAALVASVEVVQARYVFYTDSLLLCVIVAIGTRALVRNVDWSEASSLEQP